MVSGSILWRYGTVCYVIKALNDQNTLIVQSIQSDRIFYKADEDPSYISKLQSCGYSYGRWPFGINHSMYSILSSANQKVINHNE